MKTKFFWLALALMFCALPMFAQGGGAAAGTGGNLWVPVTAGFSMAIASGLCALAMGKAVAGAVEGMARNPGAANVIQTAMILGLVFMESLALYVIVIIFVKVS
ncbi:MAG: ATP synthase F0 subunit C [Acidobacteriota bacterium]|nr:ATP synthase F0 subunit C [Acidobacteriota bacterium]